MRVELHPHQLEAVEKLHNGCILYGGVGVGKTITSLGYYFTKVCGGEINKWGSMQTPKDVYVITTAKVRDSKGFEIQAAQYGVHANPKLSTNGVKITVDSWNNMKKYLEVKDAFFIFDEQRVVGYGAWSRAFIKIAKHNEWILLSATPGDTWLDYIPVFIANGWYKNKTDFLDKHVIWTPRVKYPKVLKYQRVNELVRHRNNVLVHMPYEKHTVRHNEYIVCDYDEELFRKVVNKKWHVFEKRPLRDASELFSVMRKVVNTDESRISSVRNLLKEHPKLIVFYNFDYELEMLRKLGEELTQTACTTEQQSTSPLTSSSSSSKDSSTSNSPRSNVSGLSTSGSFAVADQKTISTASGGTSVEKAESKSSTSSQPPPVAIAEWNGHKHQEIPKTDSWLYLVQYRAGAEGWNCIETDVICFFSQTYSYRDWWQAHGRIDRLNTPFTDLWYYNLVSSSIIDKAIRAALRVKKNFNERDLVLK